MRTTIDQGRQLKQQKYTNAGAVLEYRRVNTEVRKKMKEAKEEWTEQQYKDTEKGIMWWNSLEGYKPLKAPTKIQQHKSAVIKDSSGNILMESTAVLN